MNLLGKLSWNAIPFDQPIIMGATALMVVAVALLLGWITVKGYWGYLWREWITSVDHKRIGVMYCLLALVMLLRGFTEEAIGLRGSRSCAPIQATPPTRSTVIAGIDQTSISSRPE